MESSALSGARCPPPYIREESVEGPGDEQMRGCSGSHGMPDDVLMDVLSRLSGFELCLAACTSKQWNRISSKCWKFVLLRDFGVQDQLVAGQSDFKRIYKSEWFWKNRHIAPKKIRDVGPVFCLATCETRVAAGLSYGNAHVYDTATMRLLHNLRDVHSTQTLLVMCIAFITEDILALGCFSAVIAIWNTKTQNVNMILRQHAGSVNFISVHGSVLASGSEDTQVMLWNWETGSCLGSMQGHTSTVNCGKFGVKGSRVVTGGADNLVIVWDTDNRESIKSIAGHEGAVFCIGVSNQIIASGSDDNTVRLHRLDTGDCLGILKGHKGAVWDVDFLGHRLATASEDHLVKLWNTNSLQCIRTFRGHKDAIWGVSLTPTGLATGCLDGTIRMWTLAK